MGQALTPKKKRHESMKKLVQFKSKEEYLIRNGGILLEYQVRISQGRDIGARELKIFSKKEIENATNNYDENAIMHKLDREDEAYLYEAIIENNFLVSVAVPSLHIPDFSKVLLNGLSTSMAMNHQNILKIYGCCLETCLPMVVCEYVQNGSILFQQLHSDTPSKCLVWDDLMRIMTEIAYALSYMHNALSKPLVHRNLSSSSICLDTLDRAKLTRLGHTVSITPGDTSQRWHVKGTKGYIDPEYIDTHKVTDKCDVYSFGVVVIEVLTRRQPFIMARDGINLVDVFISAVRENRMKDMIDRRVLEQACWIEIQQFAQLALGCVAMKGINRPTMIDVVGQLWKIQGRDKK